MSAGAFGACGEGFVDEASDDVGSGAAFGLGYLLEFGDCGGVEADRVHVFGHGQERITLSHNVRQRDTIYDMTGPALTPPRLGDPIDHDSAYVTRASAETQAAHWNALLADDDMFGPASGLVVGVSPVKINRRYRLVWVTA